MPSVRKNLILQTCYQILSICLPLITAPYLARVLGAEALGVFSYTSSVVGYFTLFAILGTINYGTRTIASVRDNKILLSNNFFSIYTLQVISTSIFTIAYILYLFFFCQDNRTIAFIQGIALLNCMVDISWLFFGLENFTITVTRNAIVKLVTLILIFCLVKTSKDLWLYTLIMTSSTVVSQLILWLNIPKSFCFKIPKWMEIKEHIKPNLVLFFPLIAASIYHLMDKTMLGLLSNYEQTGFYYNSDKLIGIPLVIVSGIVTVLMPRMTALLQNKQYQNANNLLLKTFGFISVVCIAMGIGIAAVAKDFVPFFFGEGYEPCILLTYFFAPVFIIKSFSYITSTQFLIPRHQEKHLTNAILLGAVCNIICNILLIPPYGALGAVIGTLVAELVACIWQFRFIVQNIKLKSFFTQNFIYLLFGIIMFLGIYQISKLEYSLPIWILILLEILIGGIIYSTLCLIYWKITKNPMLEYLFSFIRDIKSRLFKHKVNC